MGNYYINLNPSQLSSLAAAAAANGSQSTSTNTQGLVNMGLGVAATNGINTSDPSYTSLANQASLLEQAIAPQSGFFGTSTNNPNLTQIENAANSFLSSQPAGLQQTAALFATENQLQQQTSSGTVSLQQMAIYNEDELSKNAQAADGSAQSEESDANPNPSSDSPLDPSAATGADMPDSGDTSDVGDL